MIVDIVFGFLGSGKTTFISQVLKEWGSAEKTVVLVNEFGEVGIDGDLLAAQGGNVVEMPSGCICCTLQADFRSQLLEITNTIKPERIIIEPTGVATITQIRSIIDAQLFEDMIRRVNNILIADATGFMGLYKANRHFVESQVKNAVIVLLNKCDKVDKHKASITRSAISAINPEVSVMMTEFGVVDREEYRLALSTTPGSQNEPWQDDHDRVGGTAHPDMEESEHGQHAHLQTEEDGLGYETHGCVLEDVSFDKQALETFFLELSAPEASLGEIVRAKGIFRIGDKGILMELASGEYSSQPMGELKQSKVSIIGRKLNRKMIDAAINRCMVAAIP
jgi:G3E family GTPase